jgi:hypothetical protein
VLPFFTKESPKVRLVRGFGFVILTISLLPLAGCATARLTQFNTFAQAGITYVTASQTVITDAGNAAVNTDSALLVKFRPDLSPAQRTARVTASDTLLKQRLHVLQLISAHGKVLQAYFQALASLSDPKATNSVGAAAQGVFDSFAKISPELKNAKIGSTSVSSFIPTVSAPFIATFKVHALDDELKARAEKIAEELALQKAAFSAIASEFKTDAQELQQFQETDSINQFAASAALPANWATTRLPLLSTPVTIASADAASQAADQLSKAWTALVADKLDSNGFTLLMGDISNILTIAQAIRPEVK